MKKLSIIAIVLLIVGCDVSDTSYEHSIRSGYQIPDSIPIIKMEDMDNAIAGTYSSSGILHSSKIKLYPNYTFTYTIKGCTGESYANGKWLREGNELILTSYRKFLAFSTPNTEVGKASSDITPSDFMLPSGIDTFYLTSTDLESLRKAEARLDGWKFKIEKDKLIRVDQETSGIYSKVLWD